ncbi:MAG: non-hydrolyzing UDP-N-acetylglucosamine 2-epimerase [Candidatus Helarchaeota archaeon]
MKIASIVGTRPNFIKLLPLAPEIEKKFDHIVIHTGQHYDYEMAQVFFESLPLPKIDYHLDLGDNWSELHKIGEILIQLEHVLLKEKPDFTLVYGDVNSTLASAITASKLKIPIGHVEAGIRLFKGSQPEEIIRKLVDNCSDLLFCPTQSAMVNLKEEKVLGTPFLVGDTMYDAFLQNVKLAKKKSIMEDFDLQPKQYYLVTVHRAETTDDKKILEAIIDIIIGLEERTVFPIHPRTEKMLRKFNLWDKCKNSEKLLIIPPVSYLNFLNLLINAKKILTDSGGVQRESYFAQVPCIILFDATPWPEITQNRGAILAYTPEKIKDAIDHFTGASFGGGFGNGDASRKIVQILENY